MAIVRDRKCILEILSFYRYFSFSDFPLLLFFPFLNSKFPPDYEINLGLL